MPRRTMTAHVLRAHQRYAREAPDHNLAALPVGGDLLDLFEEFVKGLQADQDRMISYEDELYTAVDAYCRVGRRLFIRAQTGNFGELGATATDVKSHKVKYALKADDAALVPTRSVLFVPPHGTAAVFMTEIAGRASSGSRILREFASEFWSSKVPDTTLERHVVLETEAWLEGAELVGVDAIVYGWSPDLADANIPSDLGRLEHTLRPPRGQGTFSESVWRGLRDRTLDRSKLLGFAEDVEISQLNVELRNEGRTKTFDIDHESTPPIRYVLSEGGQPVPEDDSFVGTCTEYAQEDIFPRVGGEWHSEWNT